MSSAAVTSAVPALGPDNPFPGLRPYEEVDAEWFFGRGREVNDLLKRLRRVHFLAVLGPSGCGKSSLLKAGVFPAIRDGYLDAPWEIADFRPGDQPLHKLAEAISFTDPTAVPEMRELLDRGPMGLVDAVRAQALPADTNVLVLVDQFEEVFQFAQRKGAAAQDEVKSFFSLLLSAAASNEVPIYVVLTMRLEWLSECAGYTGLAEAMNEGFYLVPQMSRRQFQQTILGPVEAAGGSITAVLLDRMLNDLDSRTDQLPVLQHALMRMWMRRGEAKVLDLPIYEPECSFSRCLSAHAEEIYGELDTEDRKAAELLFRSITQVTKNRRVRRPRPLSELAPVTSPMLERLKTVIEAFRRQGRSFIVTTPGPLTGNSIIDISHEALIRQWDRLRSWVDDEAEALNRVARLEDIAGEWNAGGRHDRSALFRGSFLRQAEDLKPRLDPDSVAIPFLEASRRAQFWNRVRWRGGWAVAAVVIAGAGFAWVRVTIRAAEQEKQTADLARQSADIARQKAEFDQRRALRQRSDYQKFVLEAVKKSAPTGGRVERNYLNLLQQIQGKQVYLQIARQDQQELAKDIQSRLAAKGYIMPGYENVGDKAPQQTQVRYFHAEDAGAASEIADLVRQRVTGPVEARLIPDSKQVVPAGQFEIWLGAAANAAQ